MWRIYLILLYVFAFTGKLLNTIPRVDSHDQGKSFSFCDNLENKRQSVIESYEMVFSRESNLKSCKKPHNKEKKTSMHRMQKVVSF